MDESKNCHVIELPLRLSSFANTRFSHWSQRHRTSKRQRVATYFGMASHFAHMVPPPPPYTITLVRIAPRRLDTDNLAAAFKAVRDGIADFLLAPDRGNQSRRWADDSDERIVWEYSQTKAGPKEYGVRILLSHGDTTRPDRMRIEP